MAMIEVFGMVLKEHKIFDGIVKAVSVDMMDNFGSSQFAAEALLHYKPVLVDAATIGKSNFSIPIGINGSLPVQVSFNNVGISETLKPLIVDIAKPLGLVGLVAARNSASKSSFSLSLPMPYIGISELSSSLEMFGTHSPTPGIIGTTLNRTFFNGHLLPPCLSVSLFHKITQNNKRCNGKHRVNSGKPLTGNAEGNPEPSQKYTSGRCRDYRRGKALLITG